MFTNDSIGTRGQFWHPGIVVVYLCPSIRPSVRHQVFPRDNSSSIRARITKFEPYVLETLVKIPVVFFCFFFWGGGGDWLWPSRSNVTSISKFPHSEFVRVITHHPSKLEPPNLDHRCKTPWLRSLLFWGVIDLGLEGQIWLKYVKFSGFTTPGNI